MLHRSACSRYRLSSSLPLLLAACVWSAPARAIEPLGSIVFDWSTYQEHAEGSDNWPLAWCEDGHQYTSWGDGGGFGGTNDDGRVSLGFGRVEGPHTSFQGINIWGGKNRIVPAEFSGKVESMLCIGGSLYGWHSTSSSEAGFAWKQLIVSDDKALSWDEDAFPSTRVDGVVGGPGLPYMINYGQNYADNSDGFLYTYWIRIQDPTVWEVQIPGVLWLMRAPVANEAFTDPANWEWYAGSVGAIPIWSSSMAARQPVLEDPDGMMRGNAIHVPGFDRYLMVTNHTQRNSGAIAIWEAPEPWGPWQLMRKESDFPEDDPGAPVDGVFTFGSFSPKWFSPDGSSGVMVFFRPDSWNSVAFSLPEPATIHGVAAGAGLLRLLARRRASRAVTPGRAAAPRS